MDRCNVQKYTVTVAPKGDWPSESEMVEAESELQAVAIMCERLSGYMMWGHRAEDCRWEAKEHGSDER